MQTKIRLARFGAKKRPFYRIVVASVRASRNGKFIDAVGTYNPFEGIEKAKVDKEKVALWIGRGAEPTGIVKQILKNRQA
jgi:small subunit ribosomal protein S16